MFTDTLSVKRPAAMSSMPEPSTARRKLDAHRVSITYSKCITAFKLRSMTCWTTSQRNSFDLKTDLVAARQDCAPATSDYILTEFIYWLKWTCQPKQMEDNLFSHTSNLWFIYKPWSSISKTCFTDTVYWHWAQQTVNTREFHSEPPKYCITQRNEVLAHGILLN